MSKNTEIQKQVEDKTHTGYYKGLKVYQTKLYAVY